MPYLLKTEPTKYSFDDLLRDGETTWDGISNPQALMNLRSMKTGEKLVIYHSNEGKAAVGTAKVVSVDATDPEESPSCASSRSSGSSAKRRWPRCARRPCFRVRSCFASSASLSSPSPRSNTTGCSLPRSVLGTVSIANHTSALCASADNWSA